jgi:hypothetical protein
MAAATGRFTGMNKDNCSFQKTHPVVYPENY